MNAAPGVGIHADERQDDLVTGRVVLPSGETVVFDPEDAELVGRYRWFAKRNRSDVVYAYGYLVGSASRAGRVYVAMHRLIAEPDPGLDVDHANGNGLDNRRANLRPATRAQNNANTRLKAGRSGYRGVTWNASNAKWQARIWVAKRCQHLGLFDDPWEAARAYNAAALKCWGEFAYQNERAA